MSRLVRALISIGLLALVLAFADLRAMWAVLREINHVWVGAALLLAFLDRVITNYRWMILLAGRGVVIGFMRLFRVQLAANFIGAFLPGFVGVDAVRITALCRSGEPTAPVIAATLVDRATLALGTLIVGALAVIFAAQARLPAHIVQFVLAVAAIGLSAVGVCLHPKVRRWVRLRLLHRVPERFQHVLMEIVNASLAYRHQWGTVARLAVLTLMLFGLRIVFAKAVAYSCGVDIPFLDLMMIIPILWIVVMIPISVGGIGVQDAGYVVLMGLLGVSAPVAVSMSLVEHIVARVASLPGALFMGEFSRAAAVSNAASATDSGRA